MLEHRNQLAVSDWVVIALYFFICLAIGIYSKYGRRKKETAEGYFLAGRSMAWWAVGGSLFASNIGSEHFVGIAGSGASSGIAVVAYEWHASWILLLLGFFFVPIYIRSKIYTMPEYLKKRFQSRHMRMYLTVISLVSYVTTKVAVDLYAGGLFLRKAVGLNIYISSAVILTFTAVYTLLGGLTAVIYTDVMQCFLMVGGAIALSVLGFRDIGGYDALWEKYPSAIGGKYMTGFVNITTNITTALNSTSSPFARNTTIEWWEAKNSTSACYSVASDWQHMFRPLTDVQYPWLGIVFSAPITGIWYWCTDQVIVQRTLGAKSIVHARLGTVMAGFMKLMPMWIMVMPGMISRVRNPNLIACPDPASCKVMCDSEYGCSNEAYPDLVLNVLPAGLVGLMLAVMIAALMSSLSSAFNSSSTIFTMDIWKVFRTKASDQEMVIVGRVVVVTLAALGIAWIPVVSQGHGGGLFNYLQAMQSYLAPPTCSVFVVGMLWPRLTEAGALTSMLFGLACGVLRLVCDVVWPKPHCGLPDERNWFVRLHFLYYALIMFVVCIILMMTISKFTRPVPLEKLGALTWKTLTSRRYRDDEQTPEFVVSTNLSDVNVMFKKGDEPRVRSTEGLNEEIEDAHIQELAEIRAFEEQTPTLKWGVRMAAVFLIAAIIALWVYYR